MSYGRIDDAWTRRRLLRSLALGGAAALLLRARVGRLAGTAMADDAGATPAAGAAGGRRLRFGMQARPEHTTYADMVEVWHEADALGLDTGFTFDHFMPIDGRNDGACFEGWTLLAALAPQTRRIRLGVLVTGNTYRHPAVLAKMAATVDHVSHGRLILGMGAGWFEPEHTAYAIPFYTPGERARRLVEAVKVVKRLFTERRSDLQGKYYTLKDAPFEPKTVQKPHPPILIGGMGPKVIRPLAARHADIWHFSAAGDVEETRRTIADFEALCRKVGRDPTAVERAVTLRAGEIAGARSEATRDRIRALADAGVQHFILGLAAPYDRDLLRRFAGDIVPKLREA